nr:reverse transcriptase [Tanacetum cinerariifolium]
MIRFGNDDFVVVAGYEDVIIKSMTIKKVYYVKDKSLNLTVSQVLETSKKDLEDLFHDFYDEYFDTSKITRSLTTNVETSNEEIPPSEEEVFHKILESFQEDSTLFYQNDDVQQSSKEFEVPSSNTQSVLNNIVPNVNEASTSHNVFNKRLEYAYFDASTKFHDQSNVHTFYQPYPHEKKTVFLNEIIQEEVYVGQPPGFVSKKYPNQVYALDKALYSLKQAPRAWYDVLSKFLIDNGFQNGSIVYALDKALYSLKQAPRAWYDVLSKFLIDNGFQNGSIGDKLVCWSSRKRNCVSLSTTEAEYVVVSGYCPQVLWMRTQ